MVNSSGPIDDYSVSQSASWVTPAGVDSQGSSDARRMRRAFRSIGTRVAAVLGCGFLAVGSTSCGLDAIGNLTSATSDLGPGGQIIPRVLRIAFINNTNFRAIFTFGSYDQLNQETVPTNIGQVRLEANSTSTTFTQPCRRTFSVGGAELIRLIKENRNSPQVNIIDERALVVGVNFSGAALGDPLEAEPTEGTADGSVKLVGVDYTCARTDIRQQTGTGLLVFTFEPDAGATGGFRIDYQFFEQ